MAANSAIARRGREGNNLSETFQSEQCLESYGNSLSCDCLTKAVEASGIPRKQLAKEVGLTESQFSKSLSGTRGGDFNCVVDRIRPTIRLDYVRRMVEREHEGGLEDLAAEELAQAAIRYLSFRRKRMAKA